MATIGSAADHVRIDFRDDQGDLDLELYDATNHFVARSDGTQDFEEVSLDGLQAGDYYVKVYGYRQITNPSYALTVNAPVTQVAPDALEPNNTRLAATDLTTNGAIHGLTGLTIHAGDVDLFKIHLSATGTAANTVSIDTGDATRLTLQLLDSTGQPVLPTSAADSTHQAISLDGRTSGTYYLRVAGATASQAGAYELHLDLPSATSQTTSRNAWTVMVYMTASDLENFAFEDINEMESAAQTLPSSVNIVVLLDQTGGVIQDTHGRLRAGQTFATGGGTQAAWGGTGRGIITADRNPNQISTRFDLIGEKNTGQTTTLVSFATWAAQVAPADHYALILWDHGAGLDGTNADLESSRNELLTTSELTDALRALRQSGISFDTIAFDACLMALTEEADALLTYTNVVVASEETEGGQGYDYRTAFGSLGRNPAGVGAEALASGIVSSYGAQYVNWWVQRTEDTHSAIRTSGIDALEVALAQFTSVCLAQQNNTVVWNALRSALVGVPQYAVPEYRDLGAYLRGVASRVPNQAIQAAAQAALAALNSTVVARTNDFRHSSGLSIYLPEPGSVTSSQIDDYATGHSLFTDITGWADFLHQFTSVVHNLSPFAPDWAGFNQAAALAFNLQLLAGRGYSFDNLNLAPAETRSASNPDPQTGEDWFRFTTEATGTSGDRVAIHYDSTIARLRLRLYSREPDGSLVPRGLSDSGSGQESISLTSLAAGEYYAVIDTPSGQSSEMSPRYRLSIDAPGSLTGTDWAAGNDRPGKAHDLGEIVGDTVFAGLAVPASQTDWFQFNTPRLPEMTDRQFRVLPTSGAVTVEIFASLDDAMAGHPMQTVTGTDTIDLTYASGSGAPYWVALHSASASPIGYSLEIGRATAISNPQPVSRPNDFDGDGRMDPTVFEPSTSTFYIASSSQGNIAIQFGPGTLYGGHPVPIPADYDGDGKTDPAVFEPSTATFFLAMSTRGNLPIQFGRGTRYGGAPIPIPADYDGDGQIDPAVFEPSTATFYLARSKLGNVARQFGQGTRYGGDPTPVVADYDGDGLADPAVFESSTATFYLARSQQGNVTRQFGRGTRYGGSPVPVPADYDGDGLADPAVFEPSTATFYLARSQKGNLPIQFGQGTRYGGSPVAVPFDYDGDGQTDPAVFEPSTATFYLARSQMGNVARQFGQGTRYGGHPIVVPADYDGDYIFDPAVFEPSTATFYLARSQQGNTITQFGQGTLYGGDPTPLPLPPVLQFSKKRRSS